jgi:putative oxidoreductase
MFMKAFAPQAYALMRFVTGLLFMFHGTQKLFSFPTGVSFEMPFHIHYIAGPIEVVGGILVAVGLSAGWAAFICSGQMAIAYWTAHAFKNLYPILNGGELAAFYCFVFLYISTQGSGIWSVDALRATGSK